MREVTIGDRVQFNNGDIYYVVAVTPGTHRDLIVYDERQDKLTFWSRYGVSRLGRLL